MRLCLALVVLMDKSLELLVERCTLVVLERVLWRCSKWMPSQQRSEELGQVLGPALWTGCPYRPSCKCSQGTKHVQDNTGRGQVALFRTNKTRERKIHLPTLFVPKLCIGPSVAELECSSDVHGFVQSASETA